MLWLTHVEVVFQASTNSRLYLDVPFPTTVALSQLKAWPDVRQKRIFILSSDGAFVFLHTCAELPAGLAHVGAGTFRAWYLVHHVPLRLRWESILHTYQRAPK